MTAHRPQGLFRIGQRNRAVAVRYAVAQHYRQNTLFAKPLGRAEPFVTVACATVSAARANHDSHAGGFIRIGFQQEVVGIGGSGQNVCGQGYALAGHSIALRRCIFAVKRYRLWPGFGRGSVGCKRQSRRQ